MKRLRVLLLRLLGIFASSRHDAEFDEELEALLQFHIAERVRSGMTPAEARRQALMRIGGTQSVKQAYRDQRGLPAVETTLQDVRFGARMLRRHRGYTAVAFLTLALGIGTTTTMFGIVDAVMLRPFPFPDPDRLVMVWEINSARGIRTFRGSAANYVDWRQSVTSVADLGRVGIAPRQSNGWGTTGAGSGRSCIGTVLSSARHRPASRPFLSR